MGGGRARVGGDLPTRVCSEAEQVGDPVVLPQTPARVRPLTAHRSVPRRTVSQRRACRARPCRVPASHTGCAHGWGRREETRESKSTHTTGANCGARPACGRNASSYSEKLGRLPGRSGSRAAGVLSGEAPRGPVRRCVCEEALRGEVLRGWGPVQSGQVDVLPAALGTGPRPVRFPV